MKPKEIAKRGLFMKSILIFALTILSVFMLTGCPGTNHPCSPGSPGYDNGRCPDP